MRKLTFPIVGAELIRQLKERAEQIEELHRQELASISGIGWPAITDTRKAERNRKLLRWIVPTETYELTPAEVCEYGIEPPATEDKQ